MFSNNVNYSLHFLFRNSRWQIFFRTIRHEEFCTDAYVDVAKKINLVKKQGWMKEYRTFYSETKEDFIYLFLIKCTVCNKVDRRRLFSDLNLEIEIENVRLIVRVHKKHILRKYIIQGLANVLTYTRRVKLKNIILK